MFLATRIALSGSPENAALFVVLFEVQDLSLLFLEMIEKSRFGDSVHRTRNAEVVEIRALKSCRCAKMVFNHRRTLIEYVCSKEDRETRTFSLCH
jgi:hypothetical protein